jgi:hypothetical protein
MKSILLLMIVGFASAINIEMVRRAGGSHIQALGGDDCDNNEGQIQRIRVPSMSFMNTSDSAFTVDPATITAEPDSDPTPDADTEDGPTSTVTTTIFEDIFLNCNVNGGTTSCTTASVVTVHGGEPDPTSSSSGKHHGSSSTKKGSQAASATTKGHKKSS